MTLSKIHTSSLIAPLRVYSVWPPSQSMVRMLYFRPLWGEVCVKIDLSKIEGEPESFAETIGFDVDRFDPARVIGPVEVRLEGNVRPVGDNYLVDGRTSASGKLSCGRCLEPVRWQMDSTFDLEFALSDSAPLDPELALGETDLNVVYLEQPFLDLEKLAIEQVVLEMPIRVLCSEECAGLCSRCGANRNVEGACRCEPEADPRWAALKDLAGKDPVD